MRAAGCSCALIGHCEERRAIAGILAQAGVEDFSVVNRILNQEVQAAAAAGLKVLYCIGEDAGERSRWREVLAEQIHAGLNRVDRSRRGVGLRAGMGYRAWENPAGPGTDPVCGRLCETTDRGNGSGLWRRIKTGQRRDAGLHPLHRRRVDRTHEICRGDPVFTRRNIWRLSGCT